MSAKTNIEALMATALYETLSEADQARLESALQADPALQDEFDALQQLVSALPTESPEFTGDLGPVIHEHITKASAPRRRLRYIAIIPALVPLICLICYWVFVIENSRYYITSPNIQTVAPDEASHQVPFTRVMESVDILLARRKPEEAVQLLSENLARFPEAPGAGLAQERYAEVNFHPLQRYEEAMAAYATLRSQYPDTFSNSPQSINRYDLLTEVAPADFAPLMALDKAREQGDTRFAAVEKVLAGQLPGSMMAQQTLLVMRDIVAAELPEDATTVAMLENIQQRCTEPTAKGQVSCALAQRYWNDQQDVDRARLIYEEVIATAPPQVAQLAQDNLKRLPE